MEETAQLLNLVGDIHGAVLEPDLRVASRALMGRELPELDEAKNPSIRRLWSRSPPGSPGKRGRNHLSDARGVRPHRSSFARSITFDNDPAFAQHRLLTTMRDMTTWFGDAYASWQKGGVENANGCRATSISTAYPTRKSERSSSNKGLRTRKASGFVLELPPVSLDSYLSERRPGDEGHETRNRRQ
jgi:hypothetical protein